jgi:hypothetical protein
LARAWRQHDQDLNNQHGYLFLTLYGVYGVDEKDKMIILLCFHCHQIHNWLLEIGLKLSACYISAVISVKRGANTTSNVHFNHLIISANVQDRGC